MNSRIVCFFCGMTLTFETAMFTRFGKTSCSRCYSDCVGGYK